MAFQLAPTAQQEGYRLEAHGTVGSTNSLALERARSGDPGRLWVTATKQESGRGRRGRAWETPEGNLAATLLYLTEDVRLAATLGFVAGIALAEALTAVSSRFEPVIGVDSASDSKERSRFELKWPNDVLADGSKLAGILLESHRLDEKRLAVAVGIGVNVVASPRNVPYPATSLREMGAACDAETLFLALSDAWSSAARIWSEGRGLSRVRTLWLERAAGLGSQVAVRVDGNVVRGVFETIDEDCRFVIRDAMGVAVRIAAGDVHFGAVASAAAARRAGE